MNQGDVVRTAYFNESRADGVRLGWKPPKDKVFVLVLLGVEDKVITDESEPLNADAAMHEMGWTLAEQQAEA